MLTVTTDPRHHTVIYGEVTLNEKLRYIVWKIARLKHVELRISTFTRTLKLGVV